MGTGGQGGEQERAAEVEVLAPPEYLCHSNAMDTSRWDDLELEHRDGTWWYQAPLPPRIHTCWAQTRGWRGFTCTDRCACGAIRLDGHGWMERNSRRRDGESGRLLGRESFHLGPHAMGMAWAVVAALLVVVTSLLLGIYVAPWTAWVPTAFSPFIGAGAFMLGREWALVRDWDEG